MTKLNNLLQQLLSQNTLHQVKTTTISSGSTQIERYDVYLKRPTLCLFSKSNNLCLLMIEVFSDNKPNCSFMQRLGTIENEIEYQLVSYENVRETTLKLTNFTPFNLFFQQVLKCGKRLDQLNSFDILKPHSIEILTLNNSFLKFDAGKKILENEQFDCLSYLTTKVAGINNFTFNFDRLTEYDRFCLKDAYWSCIQDHIIVESEIQYHKPMTGHSITDISSVNPRTDQTGTDSVIPDTSASLQNMSVNSNQNKIECSGHPLEYKKMNSENQNLQNNSGNLKQTTNSLMPSENLAGTEYGGFSNCTYFGLSPIGNKAKKVSFDTPLNNSFTIFGNSMSSSYQNVWQNKTSSHSSRGNDKNEPNIPMNNMQTIQDSFSKFCTFGFSVTKNMVLFDTRPWIQTKIGERMNKESIVGLQSSNIMDVDDACCKCFERVLSFVNILPCAHSCLCKNCVHEILKEDGSCPICRMKIQGYIF